VSGKKLIRSETVIGRVEHFRALMQRLALRTPWMASTGEKFVFYEERQTRHQLVAIVPGTGRTPFSPDRHEYANVDVTPPTRGSWAVHSEDPSKALLATAGIEAFEQPNGQTLLEFWDGYHPHSADIPRPAIGAAFEEFCEMVIREAKAVALPGDPIDQKILELVTVEPRLTDEEVGNRIGLSRGRVNERRRRLEELGYKVR
jgi:hypothetical protein